MATIFQKTSSDNCIILAPRESLVYPFNLGNWSEIRLGGFFSYTSASGDNGTGISESFSSNGGLTNLFFGIKDSGASVPFSSGTTFIGMTNNPSTTNKTSLSNLYNPPFGSVAYITSAQSSDGNPIPTVSIVSGSNIVGSANGSAGSPSIAVMHSSGVGGVTGSSSYAMFNGLQIFYDRTRNAVSGRLFQDNSYANGTSDVSITNLQSKLLSMPNVGNFVATGVWDFNTPIPNALYLYNPFLSNRIRLHSLLVDRYA